MMIFDYINQYETHKTLDTAIALCQFLLDTDQTTTHEGRKYKTLCTYLMLEGCLYDVGAWDAYMELESWNGSLSSIHLILPSELLISKQISHRQV